MDKYDYLQATIKRSLPIAALRNDEQMGAAECQPTRIPFWSGKQKGQIQGSFTSFRMTASAEADSSTFDYRRKLRNDKID
jgi:hypothetical protein